MASTYIIHLQGFEKFSEFKRCYFFFIRKISLTITPCNTTKLDAYDKVQKAEISVS